MNTTIKHDWLILCFQYYLARRLGDFDWLILCFQYYLARRLGDYDWLILCFQYYLARRLGDFDWLILCFQYYLARRLGDFARHGSMPRSTSMGIPAQQHKSARIRKNSLPSGLIDDTKGNSHHCSLQ